MLARDGGSIRNVLSEVTSINLKIKVIEDLIKTQLTAGIKQTLKSLLDKNVFKKQEIEIQQIDADFNNSVELSNENQQDKLSKIGNHQNILQLDEGHGALPVYSSRFNNENKANKSLLNLSSG